MAGVEGSGAATRFDWGNNAAQVETAINNLSEISQSRVVVTGTTALVAVKYDPQYKGETTERIREMVAGAVREADPTIQTVARKRMSTTSLKFPIRFAAASPRMIWRKTSTASSATQRLFAKGGAS